MAKSKRRAKNKIAGSLEGALVKPDPNEGAAAAVDRPTAIRVARPTLFTMELEEAIELIARERVYRAMLARLGNHLLSPPATNGGTFHA